MNTYTAVQVDDELRELEFHHPYSFCKHDRTRGDMLRAYAELLRENQRAQRCKVPIS